MREHDEPLWGYVGVRVPGAAASKVYPIGQSQAEQCLQQAREGAPWVAVTTLNNRALLIRADAVPRLSLTDNDELEPAAFYGPMVRDWDDGLTMQEYAGLYVQLELGSRFVVRSEFDARVSELASAHGFGGDDNKALFRLLRMARVHYRDGITDDMPLDAVASWALFNAVQGEPDRLLHLACWQRGLDVFVPPGQVAMLDMPLHPMRQAEVEQAAQYEAETEARAAIWQARDNGRRAA